MNFGIYLIKNIINKKIYIGSTARTFKKRKLEHWNLLNKNKHHSIHLQNAWNKYGENNFIFEVLEECEKQNLLKQEQYYLDTLNPEYNICKDAKSVLGIKRQPFSEVHLKKLSEAHKGQNAWNKNLIGYNSGENNPMYGKKFSQDHVQKLINNHWDCSGTKHPMYGKKHTSESIIKIKNKRKEQKISENTKQKLSKIMINKNIFGEKHHSSKLSNKQVEEIKTKWTSGNFSQKELSKQYNVVQSYISMIVNGKKRNKTI